jgi:hypothetical protein
MCDVILGWLAHILLLLLACLLIQGVAEAVADGG